MNITPRQILVPTVVALLTAVLFVVLLFFGTADIPACDVWNALRGNSDEISRAIVVDLRLETLQLLATLAREEDKIIIFSTHDVSSALRLASRLWLLEPSAGSDASTSGPHHSFIAGPPASLIASGHLARLFPNRAVNFDPVSLDFLPQ